MRIGRMTAGLIAGLVLALAGSTPAWAHAGLDSSSPGQGQVLAVAPDQVVLTFEEPVSAGFDAIKVYDDTMRRVDLGTVALAGPAAVVRTSLPGGLHKGTYLVRWKVVSDDNHPVTGTFQYSVGAPSPVSGAAPSDARGADITAAAAVVLRVFGYAGLVLGPVVLLVLLLLWRPGLAERWTRKLIWTGIGLLVWSTLTGSVLQSLRTSGGSAADVWGGTATGVGSTWSEIIASSRLYLSMLLGAGFAALTRSRLSRLPVLGPATVLVAAALLLTWPLTGHAVTGQWVVAAVAVGFAHLAAMSLWLGGLVLVATGLTRSTRVPAIAGTLPHFSRLAFGCVLTLVVTGLAQGWRELPTLGSLFTSRYGAFLLTKLAVGAVVIAIGNLSRQWVQRELSPSLDLAMVSAPASALPVADLELALPSAAALRALRRGIVAELGLALVILSLSALLVSTGPGS